MMLKLKDRSCPVKERIAKERVKEKIKLQVAKFDSATETCINNYQCDLVDEEGE